MTLSSFGCYHQDGLKGPAETRGTLRGCSSWSQEDDGKAGTTRSCRDEWRMGLRNRVDVLWPGLAGRFVIDRAGVGGS